MISFSEALLWVSSEPSEHILYEDLHPDLQAPLSFPVSDPLEGTYQH